MHSVYAAKVQIRDALGLSNGACGSLRARGKGFLPVLNTLEYRADPLPPIPALTFHRGGDGKGSFGA